jgi:hypothetical protein
VIWVRDLNLNLHKALRIFACGLRPPIMIATKRYGYAERLLPFTPVALQEAEV